MKKSRALAIAALAWLAPAIPGWAAAPKFEVEIVTTERADLAAGGAVRFEDSRGEVNVEAWERPDVQIVVTRLTYVIDRPADRDRATRELNDFHVAVEKQGSDVLIRSPRKAQFHTFTQIEYRVMVPHGTKLVIQHLTGAVVVGGVDGPIDASVKRGDILLRLASAGSYAFDADCREGRVVSQFAGDYHRRHLIAEHYAAGSSAPLSVHLRVGMGGIDIRKLGS